MASTPAGDSITVSEASRQQVPNASRPPFETSALNRPALLERSPLKVAVFNAHGGAHFDAIADCLKRPPLADVGTILLCEASWRMRRWGRVKFAPELAQALGMSFAFAPSFGLYEADGQFRATGVAVLCSHPLESVRTAPFPRPRLRFKNYRLPGVPQGLLARINLGGRRVSIGVIHLERLCDPVWRALQMERFLAELGGETPLIVGGDLNTTTVDMDRPWSVARAAAMVAMHPRRFRDPRAWEPLFARLRDNGFTVDGANVAHAPTFTFSRWIPPLWRPKLDWILSRGIRPVSGSARVVPARHPGFGHRFSDHDFVMCEFRL
jgi:endonuclease/exonuclease/phosphatase family metal-dependent hydrolase